MRPVAIDVCPFFGKGRTRPPVTTQDRGTGGRRSFVSSILYLLYVLHFVYTISNLFYFVSLVCSAFGIHDFQPFVFLLLLLSCSVSDRLVLFSRA